MTRSIPRSLCNIWRTCLFIPCGRLS